MGEPRGVVLVEEPGEAVLVGVSAWDVVAQSLAVLVLAAVVVVPGVVVLVLALGLAAPRGKESSL